MVYTDEFMAIQSDTTRKVKHLLIDIPLTMHLSHLGDCNQVAAVFTPFDATPTLTACVSNYTKHKVISQTFAMHYIYASERSSMY